MAPGTLCILMLMFLLQYCYCAGNMAGNTFDMDPTLIAINVQLQLMRVSLNLVLPFGLEAGQVDPLKFNVTQDMKGPKMSIGLCSSADLTANILLSDFAGLSSLRISEMNAPSYDSDSWGTQYTVPTNVTAVLQNSFRFKGRGKAVAKCSKFGRTLEVAKADTDTSNEVEGMKLHAGVTWHLQAFSFTPVTATVDSIRLTFDGVHTDCNISSGGFLSSMDSLCPYITGEMSSSLQKILDGPVSEELKVRLQNGFDSWIPSWRPSMHAADAASYQIVAPSNQSSLTEASPNQTQPRHLLTQESMRLPEFV